jgi:hypothetical protein
MSCKDNIVYRNNFLNFGVETSFSNFNFYTENLLIFCCYFNILVEQQGLPLSTLLSRFITPPEKDSAGFNQVFVINLKRRPERRIRMRRCFTELGIQATEVDAVDGR